MPIKVFRDPVQLTQHHFIAATGQLLDPHDHTPVDAVTDASFLFLFDGKKIGPTHILEGLGREASAKNLLSLMAKNVEAELARDKTKDGFFGIDPARTTVILNGRGQRMPQVSVTGALLAHEQVHYDIFFLVAQAAIRAIEALAEVSDTTFLSKADALWKSHVVDVNCRNDVLQRLYDEQTRHGADQTFQGLWSAWAAQSLAQPEPFAIGAHVL